MPDHAFLSASSSHRWLECPPSAMLCAAHPSRGSPFAQQGTDAHTLAAYKLERALGRKARDPTPDLDYYDAEMSDCTDAYVSFVMEQLAEAKQHCKDPIVLVEQKLDFCRWVESVSIIETKENSSQSLPPSAEPLFIDSNPTETVVSDEMTYPRWVLRILLSKLSDGKCECCGNPAPFRGKDMAPYLMLHHIDKSKGDTLTNCVVLCPNCNMKLAHLQDEQMDNELQEKASQHSVSVLFEPYQF